MGSTPHAHLPFNGTAGDQYSGDPDPDNDPPEVRNLIARQKSAAASATPSSDSEPPGRAHGAAVAGSSPADSPSGATVILAYFRERYHPVFRRGNAIYCADGREVPMGEACAVPDSDLITRLAGAADAPRFSGVGGGVKWGSLPSFFKTWARVAWGDLLRALPEEDDADPAETGPAREEFRRMVRDALLSEVTLGDVIGRVAVVQTERRSLIGWCIKFAKPGNWQSIRSKCCWCKLRLLPGGAPQFLVAVRHGLFAQVRADRRLCELTPTKFTRRAKRYGVGDSTRADRPGGEAAVVLSADFLAEVTAALPNDPEGDTEVTGVSP
jgi:hypothetical protein